MCVCVSLCVWLYGRKNETKTGEWEVDQRTKEKEIHVCILTRESACVILCACVPVIVFEVRRKETCISVPMLYSAGHTHMNCINTSKMNCNSTLLGREGEEFYLFIYFYKAQSTLHHKLTYVVLCSNMTTSPLLTYPCDWIHHADTPKLWPLWKWTWSFNLSPVTPPPPSQSHG